ncbi:MAG: hypothetical protein M0R33_18890 [Methylomonas sp.]|jgi:hypothetical protein|uniref:hypothetical protein n=1 Tax=Methylomonas sp. TaxID=418 RepID=UPI0025FE657F|nr:hypothetical protein [Methylomonas sp.]MCK9608512.1 hypothetical protein [Methylomonas sp.]
METLDETVKTRILAFTINSIPISILRSVCREWRDICGVIRTQLRVGVADARIWARYVWDANSDAVLFATRVNAPLMSYIAQTIISHPTRTGIFRDYAEMVGNNPNRNILPLAAFLCKYCRVGKLVHLFCNLREKGGLAAEIAAKCCDMAIINHRADLQFVAKKSDKHIMPKDELAVKEACREKMSEICRIIIDLFRAGLHEIISEPAKQIIFEKSYVLTAIFDDFDDGRDIRQFLHTIDSRGRKNMMNIGMLNRLIQDKEITSVAQMVQFAQRIRNSLPDGENYQDSIISCGDIGIAWECYRHITIKSIIRARNSRFLYEIWKTQDQLGNQSARQTFGDDYDAVHDLFRNEELIHLYEEDSFLHNIFPSSASFIQRYDVFKGLCEIATLSEDIPFLEALDWVSKNAVKCDSVLTLNIYIDEYAAEMIRILDNRCALVLTDYSPLCGKIEEGTHILLVDNPFISRISADGEIIEKSLIPCILFPISNVPVEMMLIFAIAQNKKVVLEFTRSLVNNNQVDETVSFNMDYAKAEIYPHISANVRRAVLEYFPAIWEIDEDDYFHGSVFALPHEHMWQYLVPRKTISGKLIEYAFGFVAPMIMNPGMTLMNGARAAMTDLKKAMVRINIGDSLIHFLRQCAMLNRADLCEFALEQFALKRRDYCPSANSWEETHYIKSIFLFDYELAIALSTAIVANAPDVFLLFYSFGIFPSDRYKDIYTIAQGDEIKAILENIRRYKQSWTERFTSYLLKKIL